MTLSVRHLSVAYDDSAGDGRAVHDVSLSLAAGEIVGLVGESGCGKSTLASALLRVLPATASVVEGEIELQGKDVLQLPEAAMRDMRGNTISIVFQNPAECLQPVLTIGRQMIDIQHRSHVSAKEKRRRAREMLIRVGIGDADRRLDQYVHQLSGGTVQRIALAMAVLTQPEVLVCDEPTSAVDAAVENQMLNFLTDYRHQSGCSILFISHHLAVIERVCDSVVVMYAGEVVESGRTIDVFERPRHPYTRLLMDCDSTRGESRRIRSMSSPLVGGSSGCRFVPRCGEAVDRCRGEHPELRSDSGDSGRSVRCHRVELVTEDNSTEDEKRS